MNPELPEWGELWWCDLPLGGRRPAVVLTRNEAIPRLRRVLVAPCTTRARGLATEVPLDPAVDPVPRECVVGLDAIEVVPVTTLDERIGWLSPPRMREVCAALEVAVDCPC
jgi:mRNA interferase MazF